MFSYLVHELSFRALFHRVVRSWFFISSFFVLLSYLSFYVLRIHIILFPVLFSIMCIAFTGHPIAAFLNRSYSSSVISLVCTGSFSCVLSFRFILPSLFIVQFSGSDAS